MPTYTHSYCSNNAVTSQKFKNLIYRIAPNFRSALFRNFRNNQTIAKLLTTNI